MTKEVGHGVREVQSLSISCDLNSQIDIEGSIPRFLSYQIQVQCSEDGQTHPSLLATLRWSTDLPPTDDIWFTSATDDSVAQMRERDIVDVFRWDGDAIRKRMSVELAEASNLLLST